MRIIGIDVPGFGVPTHAEAKDVLAGAMLQRTPAARLKAGPVTGAAGNEPHPTSRRSALLGEVFPADPMVIGMMLGTDGAGRSGPVVPTREWRELYAALDCTPSLRSTLLHRQRARIRSRGRPAHRRLGSGGGTTAPQPGCSRHRQATERARSAQYRSRPHRTAILPAIDAAPWPRRPIKGRITVSGYEGSELLGGAPAGRKRRDRALRRHCLPAHACGPIPTVRGWRRAACEVQYRASLEQDLAACIAEFRPRSGHRHDASWCRHCQGDGDSVRCTSPTSSRPAR